MLNGILSTMADYTNFWRQVQKTDTCWIWQGERAAQFGRTNKEYDRKLAHIVSWFATTGELLRKGLQHTCENTLCVNPEHLVKLGTTTDAKRFWKKVEKTEGCWMWTAATNENGYGVFSMRGHNEMAHRFSMKLQQEVPDELHVLHECDNPPCVRPDHLFVGTDLDNAQDRDQKGRGNRGERNGHAKFSEEDVRQIREAHANGTSMYAIAKARDVWFCTISRIIRNEGWTHVA